MMKKRILFISLMSIMLLTFGQESRAETDVIQRPEEDPGIMMPAYEYELSGAAEVDGRQGVCSEGDYYWVSGSATLAKYDKTGI